MVLHNIGELSYELGSDVEHLKRDVYKYTACGAWIEWTDRTVTIGSIVEGSDAEFDRTFEFPVYLSEIDNWFDELERLTDEAWQEANGDEEE